MSGEQAVYKPAVSQAHRKFNLDSPWPSTSAARLRPKNLTAGSLEMPCSLCICPSQQPNTEGLWEVGKSGHRHAEKLL